MALYRLLFLFLLIHPPLHALFDPHPDNKAEGRLCTVSICCVFQNEAEWLREWIEFHRLVGVEHFYLYNNVSTDNYLDVLAPYLAEGIVELFDFPTTPLRTEHQKAIYDHAVSESKGYSEWLAIIDTDEFIVPLETKSLITYLRSLPEDIGGIEVHWQAFGTSGVKSLQPGELLIEKLILKAPVNDEINRQWFKSLVRPHSVTWCISAHSCLYQPGFKNVRIQSDNYIRIHHYMLRTEDFFYQVKLPRIQKWDANFFHIHSIEHYLTLMNSITDLSMQPFVPALKRILYPHIDIPKNSYDTPSLHPTEI
jgi:hypothetical protein